MEGGGGGREGLAEEGEGGGREGGREGGIGGGGGGEGRWEEGGGEVGGEGEGRWEERGRGGGRRGETDPSKDSKRDEVCGLKKLFLPLCSAQHLNILGPPPRVLDRRPCDLDG